MEITLEIISERLFLPRLCTVSPWEFLGLFHGQWMKRAHFLEHVHVWVISVTGDGEKDSLVNFKF